MARQKFYIGEISDLIGVPASVLRFYETKGVLEPDKETENNYRLYAPEESCRVLMARLYRSFGFSLEESVEMVGRNDRARNEALLADRLATLDSELRRLEAVRDSLTAYQESLREALDGLDSPRIDILSARLFLSKIRNGTLVEDAAAKSATRRWIEYLPTVSYSFLLEYPSMAAEWGFSLTLGQAAELGEKEGGPIVAVGERTCLEGFFLRSSAADIVYDEVAPVYEAVSRLGYVVGGLAFGRFLAMLATEGEPKYLYSLHIPIKKA